MNPNAGPLTGSAGPGPVWEHDPWGALGGAWGGDLNAGRLPAAAARQPQTVTPPASIRFTGCTTLPVWVWARSAQRCSGRGALGPRLVLMLEPGTLTLTESGEACRSLHAGVGALVASWMSHLRVFVVAQLLLGRFPTGPCVCECVRMCVCECVCAYVCVCMCV